MRASGQKVLLLFALFLCSSLLAQESGSISGVVVDSRTGTPLAGVEVNLLSSGRASNITTDGGGRFRISGVAPGDYAMQFDRPDYMWFYLGSGNGQERPVHVGPGESVSDIRILLVPYGSLEGRAFDPDGNPVAKAAVHLANELAETDADGRYHFTDIVPHSYMLRADPPRQNHAAGPDRLELIRTFYPSVSEMDQAQQIAISAGDKLTGYDIHLALRPVYRVSGVVLRPDGKPQSDAVLWITTDAESPTMFVRSSGDPPKKGARPEPFARTPLGAATYLRNPGLRQQMSSTVKSANDGTFEFAAVPRGTRILVASLDGMGLGSSVSLPLAVDHDIDNLRIQMSDPIDIDAVVEIGTSSGRVNPDVVQQAFINIAGKIAFADANGAIRVRAVTPGEYQVAASAGLNGGYYLSAITLGGRDVSGQLVNLQAGSPPIHLIYKPDGGTVIGTIESGKSAILIPVDSLTVARITPVGDDRKFELRSLAPGSYYGFAGEMPIPGPIFDPAAIVKIRATARLINVQAGSTVDVTLPKLDLE